MVLMPEDRKLLEPLSSVVSGALRLLVGLLLISFILSLFDNAVPFWSGADHCVTANSSAASSTATDAMFNTAAGARVSAIPRYCAEDPTDQQRLLGLLSAVPYLAFAAGGLVLLNGMLRAAARDGVYTTQTASRLKVLGWWLLVGSLVAELSHATAETALLATLASDVHLSAETVLRQLTAPYLMVLTGLGLLTFARITRAGAAMREDLEGTV